MNRITTTLFVALMVVASSLAAAELQQFDARLELRRLPAFSGVAQAYYAGSSDAEPDGGPSEFVAPSDEYYHDPTVYVHTYTHTSLLGGFHRPDQATCWYGGLSLLVLDRALEHNAPFTLRNTTAAVLLSSSHVESDWTASASATIGRYVNPCWAVEMTFWESDPTRRTDFAVDPNDAVTDPNLVPVLDFSPLNYDDLGGLGNVAASDYFTDARVHRLAHDWEILNAELNLVRIDCAGVCCGRSGYPVRYSLRCAAGVRYVRFADDFRFSSDPSDAVFSGDNSEVDYVVDVDNHLLALQLGCQGDVQWNHHAALRVGLKVGACDNFVDQHSLVGGAAGPAVVTAGPDAGQEFDLRSDTTHATLLVDSEIGLIYQFSRYLRAAGGYRVFLLSGVAESTRQIPADFGDLDAARRINTGGDLLLHGLFGSLEFNF